MSRLSLVLGVLFIQKKFDLYYQDLKVLTFRYYERLQMTVIFQRGEFLFSEKGIQVV